MTAGGISVHVMDVVRGVPAQGLKVEIRRLGDAPEVIATGTINGKGGMEHPVSAGAGVVQGLYEAVFYVGDFYRDRGDPIPDIPFLDIAPFRFGISDVAQHYHLPMKVSPWGFSIFRGGA